MALWRKFKGREERVYTLPGLTAPPVGRDTSLTCFFFLLRIICARCAEAFIIRCVYMRIDRQDIYDVYIYTCRYEKKDII